MNDPLPLTRELLLIGGGHTHALVLRMWGVRQLAGVRLTVVNPHPSAPYTGMLPGFVAGHYSREDLDIDLVRLARFAGARIILDRATGLDTENNRVTLSSGRVLPYHAVSIDIGITSDLPEIPGFSMHGIPAKPLDVFADRWTQFLDNPDANDVVVIGGGVGGAELSLAMQHRLKTAGKSTRVKLIERDNPLSDIAQSTRQLLIQKLAADGITVLTDAEVARVSENRAYLLDGREISAGFVVGVAGARPYSWLQDTGLHLTNGFISVQKTLQSHDIPNVFAVGDCAHMLDTPRPKAGVFAVRQAPILYQNMRAFLCSDDLAVFEPQQDYLKLISLGEKSAVATKWRLHYRGPVMWRWKNHIDRTFMDQFTDIKPMAGLKLPAQHADGVLEALGDKPLCGGCGAKVGSRQLSQMLKSIPDFKRDDVLSEPGDDAAQLSGPGNTTQVITTDHLRAFVDDPYLMAKITAVHALGDIWAMGGQPQSALATIILPRLSTELQASWLAEIMTAAHEVFSQTGASIVGGHTSIGNELTIGFTVTGLCTKNPISLAGAKAGDHLILTKPIGSGTILAGEMALAAKGFWVAQAYQQMMQPQGAAAEILKDAHAMTDVTGFGLAGHLIGIAKASNVGIEISIGDVKFMEGAVSLSQNGIRSSLFEQNAALAPELSMTTDPKTALLFDPQTAGGLVAAVSAKKSAALVRQLDAQGFDASVIGKCTVGQPKITLT